MKKAILRSILVCMFIVPSVSVASVYDVEVTASNDIVNYRSWGWGGSYTANDGTANPNIVYHSYEPGNGNSANTTMVFDLGSVSVNANDINSVTFNFDIIDHWTSSRDDIGSFSGGGTVYYSAGIGLTTFDITDAFKSAYGSGATSVTYSLNYTGYSGFTFGSADGDDPAFLRITTSANDNPINGSPVPVPNTMALLGVSILGIAAIGRWRK